MPDDKKSKISPLRSAGRYIVIGLVTAAPLAITWWIVSFLFTQLSELGMPWVWGLSQGIRPRYPALADFMLNETVQSVAAVVTMLVFLCVLGWATGRVIGQRLIRLFESFIGAIPFVDSIYRATKRFLAVAGSNEGGARRVVLIDFPSPEMKAIGLVTRIMRDRDTGEELAAVYVPTSPNPTSGYIEIVPLRSVVFTDWTFDQAMSFVVTGGSNAPETIAYSTKGPEKGPADPPAKAN
jgi:uncharacterized membrane protein